MPFPAGTGAIVQEALRALGVRRLVLGIHDPAFPGEPGDDTGRGSPYSRGAERLLDFAVELGFRGVQLGPQGQTSLVNPSPYDGTIFSRNVLSLALPDLCQARTDRPPLLSRDTLSRLARGAPAHPRGDVPYRYAFAAQQVALAEAFTTYERAAPPELDRRMREFWQHNQAWLERDVLYQVLTEAHGGQGFRDWTLAGGPHPDQDLWQYPPGQAARVARRQALLRDGQRTVKAYVMAQLLVHEQHADLRGRRPGLELLGDLQVGLADQDVFSYRSLLLSDYVMGAPPSRTTPAGQAWGYAVLDPEQCDPHQPERNPALQLLRRRMDKMFDEYDAIRIDHPHGFVCPWVYRPQPTDPLAAVQHGARLFSSPDLPDHPGLARYAIVKPEQLCRAAARYADDWETDLRPEQIDRFAILFDVMVDSAHRHGKASGGLLCEVLSTLPRPLRAVLERHDLGRFRVVQKADPTDASDVYRAENARPADWIMAGNHDTLPIWTVVKNWQISRRLEQWSELLAGQLDLDAATLIHDQGLLVHALFAYLLASPAENVSVFFTDLLGCDRPYNKPGTIDDDNWSLRLAPDFAGDYARRLRDDRALNLPFALALALGGRGPAFHQGHGALTAELLRRANTLRSPSRPLAASV